MLELDSAIMESQENVLFNVILIYPPLMHNRLVKDSSRMTKVLNVVLSGVGVFAAAAVAASYTTIASWDEGAEG